MAHNRNFENLIQIQQILKITVMHGLSRNVCMSSRTCTHYFKLKSGSLNIPRSWFFVSAFTKVSKNCKKCRHYLPGGCRFGYSSKAFIYSLTNNNGPGSAVYNPVKLQVKPDSYQYAVTRCNVYGPTFGSNDLLITNNAASKPDSSTSCGTHYPLPSGYSLPGHNCKFYAGSYRFTPTDIEVFYETTT